MVAPRNIAIAQMGISEHHGVGCRSVWSGSRGAADRVGGLSGFNAGCTSSRPISGSTMCDFYQLQLDRNSDCGVTWPAIKIVSLDQTLDALEASRKIALGEPESPKTSSIHSI